MRTTFIKTKKSIRLFFYGSLAVLLALVGVRQADNGTLEVADDTRTDNDSTDTTRNLVPFAYAGTAGGGGDGCADGGGGGGCGCDSDSDGGSDCCLPAGSLVRTTDGLKAIEDITVDTTVIAYDHEKAEWSTAIVGQVIVHDGQEYQQHNFEIEPMYILSFEDASGSTKEITITGNHPCYIVAVKDYVPVRDIQVGDMLLTPDGQASVTHVTTVDHTSYFADSEPIVFNLHMQSGPNNYVADNVLVHNQK